ncbi:peptidylprolyl isomerase [Lacinutrix neustonica]|uniref:peptidylprolyl isomerase n=1 Tax=Lacinutrix neustonica TaxID=2980107 RepID=UPI0028BEDFE8|nr:peptidylprolyl isomerase [Lacinutrix neustonica]
MKSAFLFLIIHYFLFMRITLIFCTFFLLFNCGEDHSKQKKTSSTTIRKEIKKVKDTTGVETPVDSSKLSLEERYLPLNDDNAMAFFREYGERHPENKVRIYTEFGNIDIQLFDKTEFHRANFIFLTKNKIFDGTQFHRVVKDFVIQGGNSDDRDVVKKRGKIGRYLLPPRC